MLKEAAPENGVLSLSLFNTPSEIPDELLKHYRVVVVDVLRSATSIAMALANGAREVIPTASVAAGIELSRQLSRKDVLLCGERDGKIVEGFDLGNSPGDFTQERVAGRTLIFGSTNGTPLVVQASPAKQVIVCGFINLTSVAKTLAKGDVNLPVAIACAGQDGGYSLDDVVRGGLLISRLRLLASCEMALNDAAVGAEIVSCEFIGDLGRLVRDSEHGRYLSEIGAGSDLEICAQDSTLTAVPVLYDGKLALPKQAIEQG